MQIIDIHMSLRGAVQDLLARAVAIAGLSAIALIHVLQVPDAFDEAGYLGVLFIGAAAGSIALATALTRTDDTRVWAAAGALPAAVLLCYVISRAVGLPGFTGDIGEWSEAPGLASMVAESLVIAVSAAVLTTRRREQPAAAPEPAGRPAVA
jgi:hypothetical protein